MPIILDGTKGETFPSWTTGTRPATPNTGQTGYNTTLAILETYNGSAWVNTGAKNSITQTIYTSGSGTYTTPAGVTWLRVRMVGGGGGGSGSGGSGGTGGTAGNTTFGSSTCNGGVGGVTNNLVGAAGGTASISGGSGIALQGGYGGACVTTSAGSTYPSGGNGGVSPFGGAASGGGGSNFANISAYPAVANSGSGGGGAGGSATTTFGGCGGGAGGYIDMIISAPSATYSYAIGAGGTAGAVGSSGYIGSAGGSGIIIIEEHYNW